MTTQETDTMAALRADETFAPWLVELDRIGPPPESVELPDGGDLDDALEALTVPVEDRPALLAQREFIDADPDLWWLLERSVGFLLRHMDVPAKLPGFPALPDDQGEVARSFYTWVYVGMLPHARALYRTRGIPDDILTATMADVGRQFTIHRAPHGIGGMAGQDWLMRHPRGVIYQLGRLQFERARLGGHTSRGMQAEGIACEQGEPVLAVHIPRYMGPMTPEACDDAFAQAHAFFARHYPEETYRFATCHSWLLDPQLGDYLPPESNIIRFQQRFRLAYTPDYGDRGTLEFVFRTPDHPLDDLPQRTTLERAVVRHLRDGKHWHGGAGWLSLDPPIGKEHAQ
jgi:GNAT-like C-terminal domain/N-acyltransferase N-terminal domain